MTIRESSFDADTFGIRFGRGAQVTRPPTNGVPLQLWPLNLGNLTSSVIMNWSGAHNVDRLDERCGSLLPL